MNASDRPNTCKSRGIGGAAMRPPATGARVSNTYGTCPLPADNRGKPRLNRHIPLGLHGLGGKSTEARDGPTKATMRRGSERKAPHIGTETRAKLLREAAVRDIGQWAEA